MAKIYHVKGTCLETGEPTSLPIQASSASKAVEIAESRGLHPVSVKEDDGHGNKPGRLATEDKAEMNIMILSFLIPPVGFIVGSIRLANKEQSGMSIILSAIAGMLTAAVLLAVWA